MRSCLVLAALLFAASPARTEPCRLCAAKPGEQQGKHTASLTLETESTLDFDRIVLLGESGGTARLGVDGSRSVTGGIAPLSGRSLLGTVTVRGEPGRLIRVELPRRLELRAFSGGRVVLERLSTDLAPNARLDGSGQLTFRFGGDLTIDGTAEGDYRGEVPIIVEYPSDN